MQNIKVFIASSAELDEDKIQIDLYFSQKNKEYRSRYVNFLQKTWKDFPSYLDKVRLQERYNEYIRQCDIVIFLFHTRMGNYTLEELEVAFAQLIKNKKKSPKIYVYVKEGPQQEEILDKLKQYSEYTYGHFCDIYSDYNALFRHLDYQLQQLENEGFIKPDPIDLKRITRFVLLGILPLIATLLILLISKLSQPASLSVDFNEKVKTHLPFKGGQITLSYADVEKTLPITSLDNPIAFRDIHKKNCWLDDFRIRFSADGYQSVDSIIEFTEHLTLPVVRDGKAGVIKGLVTDEDRNFIQGAIVKVLEYSCVSQQDGSFSLKIPLEEQRTTYRLMVNKTGYQTWDYNKVSPSYENQMIIVLKK